MCPDLTFVAAVREPNSAVVERRLHDYFAEHNSGLEWFHDTSEEVRGWVEHFCASPHTAKLLDDLPDSLALNVYPWDRPDLLVDETGQTVLPMATLYRPPIGGGTGQTSSESEDWYTPALYVDAVREVFGGTIDLDPMSCVEANRTVRAERFFTAEVDGLNFPWNGNVFVNPPWGGGKNSTKTRAVAKALEQYRLGNAKAVIFALNSNALTSSWFSKLLGAAAAIAIPNHRVRHMGPGGKGGAPNSGTVFVYIGLDVCRFTEAFQRFGTVCQPLATGGDDLAEDEV